MLALVAYSLKPVKILGPCKRTQHCWPTATSNVGSCWHLLRPFAWVLRLKSRSRGYQSAHMQRHELSTSHVGHMKYSNVSFDSDKL